LPRTHQLLKEILDMGESFSINHDTYLQEWFLKQYGDSINENSSNNKNFSEEQDDMKILREKTDKLNRIVRDSQYFSYTLNFKGLLLFLILYGSIKKSKSEKLLFDKVLSNPSIVKIAPFLRYLNEFEELGFKGKELIVTIAEELRNQLHLDIPNGNFLLERAIERYYKEFQKYILPKQSPLYVSLINDYQKNMISLLKDFIKDKQPVFGFSLE